MRVSELMTRRVACVRSDDRASVAARIMWDCDCGAVPVLGDDDRVIAMITDRDICMATLFQELPPGAVPVWSAMSKELHACGPEDSISTAEQVMRARQIRRLPVLDAERRLLGMLSLADIIRSIEREKGRTPEMFPEVVTATLAEICTRRPSAATH